jgi:acetolactate synthase regulatory subunit
LISRQEQELNMMQVFTVRYRNTQGTLMRILNAVSRRGLDIISVHAERTGSDFQVALAVPANPRQASQLHREWYAIVDVTHVTSAPAHAEEWSAPHPPAGVCIESRAAAGA